MTNCICTRSLSGGDDIREKEKRCLLKEVYDELNHISEDLSCCINDRSRIKAKCCAALLSLRCTDRKLRLLLDDAPRCPVADLETSFGANAKLEQCIEEHENTKKKMDALRTEWYMQEEHMAKISSQLRAAEQELEMQSIYCTHQGLLLSRLLWKITSIHYMVEFVTSNCSGELEEILRLIDSCIYGYMKTYSDEPFNVDSEECQYLVALCGILTNISSVPDGRHFLMNATVSRDIYDLIIKVIPCISTDDLKWLMLVCVYNILGNPVGLKYAAKEERLGDAIEECLAPYHTHRIIGTALRISKYLVDDLSDPNYFVTLFKNLPLEDIIQLIHARESSIRKLAKTIISKIGAAFEEYQGFLKQHCPLKPCKQKAEKRIVRRVPSRHSSHKRNIRSVIKVKSTTGSSTTACTKSTSKVTSKSSMTTTITSSGGASETEITSDAETTSSRTTTGCSTPSSCLKTQMSVNKRFNDCPSEKKMFVSSPSVAITAKVPMEAKIKDSDTINSLHKQLPCTDFSSELSKYAPSREPSNQSDLNSKKNKISIKTIYCTSSGTKPMSSELLDECPSLRCRATQANEDKSTKANEDKSTKATECKSTKAIEDKSLKATEDKSTTVMFRATSSCQMKMRPSHVSTAISANSVVPHESAPCSAMDLKSSTTKQTKGGEEDNDIHVSTSMVFTRGDSGVIVSLLSKLDLDNYLRPSYSGVGIPFKNKKKATVLVSKKSTQGPKPTAASKICRKDNKEKSKEKPKVTKFSSCECADSPKGATQNKAKNNGRVAKKP